MYFSAFDLSASLRILQTYEQDIWFRVVVSLDQSIELAGECRQENRS
jgi:hypothetical protein